VVCLHDVSIIAIGVEGADQGEEEPSHHHVAPGMSLPHKPSHVDVLSSGFVWVTTTGDSRSSVGVSCALLSSRKFPPDEEILPNTYTLG
jgi:hypothetical protein